MLSILYLYWHYSLGAKQVARDGLRLIFGIFNFFSISHLFRTLLYPWHQYSDQYKSGFDLGVFLWALSGNMISRGLGAIVRTITIFIGLFFSACAFAFAVFCFFLWLILPLAIPTAIILGIIIIF
ncbi:MAG: hypothetical protein AAB362_00885 [Patescibacteria group bacterium]